MRTLISLATVLGCLSRTAEAGISEVSPSSAAVASVLAGCWLDDDSLGELWLKNVLGGRPS